MVESFWERTKREFEEKEALRLASQTEEEKAAEKAEHQILIDTAARRSGYDEKSDKVVRSVVQGLRHGLIQEEE